MRVHKVQYANLFGDARAEQIWVEEDQNGSEVLKLGVPRGEITPGQIPKYQELNISPLPVSGKDSFNSYKISDFGTADLDGDGQLDLYYSYIEYTDLVSTKKQTTGKPVNVVLFHDDIVETVREKLGVTEPEAAIPSSYLEWRVRELEQRTRRLEWAIDDLEIVKRHFDERIAALENKPPADDSKQTLKDEFNPKPPKPAPRPAPPRSENPYLEFRVDELERKLRWKDMDIAGLDWDYRELDGRVDKLEKQTAPSSYLPYSLDNGETKITDDMEFRIWLLENELDRLEWRLEDVKAMARDIDKRLTELESKKLNSPA